jgi:hypothetical protein
LATDGLHRIVWTRQARDDLDRIREYIGQFAPLAAQGQTARRSCFFEFTEAQPLFVARKIELDSPHLELGGQQLLRDEASLRPERVAPSLDAVLVAR